MPAGQGDVTFQFYNAGSSDGYVGYGMTSTAAQANAVIPVGATMPNAVPVPQGAVLSYTLAGGLFMSVVTPTAGNTTIIVTPGRGC